MKIAIACLAVLLLTSSCSRQQSQPEAAVAPHEEEIAAVAVTRWSDKTELFMEYPPFVVGGQGRAAVHFTELDGFKALTEGTVVIELRQAGSVVEQFRSEAPSRPGIFGVDLRATRPGQYELVVILQTARYVDTHALGNISVYASADQVPAPEEAEEEGVSFLKEQQWMLDFATVVAGEQAIRESIQVTAEIKPRTGGAVIVTAPIAGRIVAGEPLPAVGATVAAGQVLAAIAPPTPDPAELPAIQLEIVENTAHLQHARRDRQRAERLMEAGAIPEKRLHDAQEEETLIVARLRTAEERLERFQASRAGTGEAASSQFAVVSPISGVVESVIAANGATVQQGEQLLRIVAVDRVHVVADVPEAYVARMSQLSGAELEWPQSASPVPLTRRVAISPVMDAGKRTLSIVYEMDNSSRRAAIGQAVSVRLFLSAASRTVAIPDTAIIDDGGRPVVFVQLDGEAFARRPVQLGARASGNVQVLSGVKAGERVVTRGAYLIRLAALSPTIPAHGHAH